MMVQLERRLWTVEEYHEMVEAGILQEDDRLELMEGEVITMSPVGVRHIACVNRLNDLLTAHFRGRAVVSVQNPVRLDDLSEPQPDVILMEYRDDFYASRAATAEDVLLIEVSDSPLAYNRQIKRPLYAKSGIPEYWIVNLIDNTIEVHREPQGDGYRERFVVDSQQMITAVAFPDVTFQVEDLIR